jgi:hypothetical protein
MAGATGLRYEAVWSTLAGLGLRPRLQRRVFDDIQAMERAALDAWDEQRAQRT